MMNNEQHLVQQTNLDMSNIAQSAEHNDDPNCIGDRDSESLEDQSVHEETNVESVVEAVASANIAALIMLKVPTFRLPYLREAYEKKKSGLDLYDFLHAFLSNMNLENDHVLLTMVPE